MVHKLFPLVPLGHPPPYICPKLSSLGSKTSSRLAFIPILGCIGAWVSYVLVALTLGRGTGGAYSPRRLLGLLG